MTEKIIFGEIMNIIHDSPTPAKELRHFWGPVQMDRISPFLEAFSQPQGLMYHRRRPVGIHTFLTLANTGTDTLQRLAALFHDIGKTEETRRYVRGVYTYPKHAEVGAVITGKFLWKMGFPREDTDNVVWLVGHHDLENWHNWSEVKQMDIVNHPLFNDLVALRHADIMGQNGQLDRLWSWLKDVSTINHEVLYFGRKPFTYLDTPVSNETIDNMLEFRVGMRHKPSREQEIESMRVLYIRRKYKTRKGGITLLKRKVIIPRLPDERSIGTYLHESNVPPADRSKIIKMVKAALWVDRVGFIDNFVHNINATIKSYNGAVIE